VIWVAVALRPFAPTDLRLHLADQLDRLADEDGLQSAPNFCVRAGIAKARIAMPTVISADDAERSLPEGRSPEKFP